MMMNTNNKDNRLCKMSILFVVLSLVGTLASAFVPSTTPHRVVATVPRVNVPQSSRSFFPNHQLVDLMPANDKGDIIQRQSTADASDGEKKKGFWNGVSVFIGLFVVRVCLFIFEM